MAFFNAVLMAYAPDLTNLSPILKEMYMALLGDFWVVGMVGFRVGFLITEGIVKNSA